MKNQPLLDRLPSHFNVGWAKFKFVVKKGLKSGGEACYGTTDFNTNIIALEKDMPDDVAHPTIIHEVCHALMETFGLGGSESDKEGSLSSTNEFVTEACCRAMLMFKTLNPELWDLLFVSFYEEKVK